MLGLAGARGGHIGTIQVVGGGEIEAGVRAVSRRVVVVVVVVVVVLVLFVVVVVVVLVVAVF